MKILESGKDRKLVTGDDCYLPGTFNKKSQVLHLERNSSMHQYKLGPSNWRASWQMRT